MASMSEITQLCRLCLIKDEVNVPIFQDVNVIDQIFLKISACLPIKVSKEDKLPKKICDACSYKLELFYDFLNTSKASEKQLRKWIDQLGAEKESSKGINPTTIILKQEIQDPAVDLSQDELSISTAAHNYSIQQQQLSYGETVEFELPQEGFININEASTVISSSRKRPAESEHGLSDDSEYDDDVGLVGSKITKMEDDEDSEIDADQTAFIDLPSGSGENDQAGPSGVGKETADAPYRPLTALVTDATQETIYECEVCTETFTSRKDFLAHHMNQFGQTFSCCKCGLKCKTTTELYNHYEMHKTNTIIIEHQDDSNEYYDDNNENVEENMISIPNETLNDSNELLYILDGSQCVNEIVIEDEEGVEETIVPEEVHDVKSENFRILHLDHGYMLPSIFKGQLESKRRYTKKDSVSETLLEIEPEYQESESNEMTLSKHTYINVPKARPKRRHEVPDFSATSYIVINPNEEIDMTHYKCLRCEQLFISKFTFFRHIEKGKCYINSCDVCSASFEKNSEFYEHYLAEHTDRAICNFCFRTFMYEKNVKEHMLRHLDQFRHRCEECNKGFYTVREYRNHYKNRHMGIRHKCEVCGRSFADEYYFKRHVATHEKAIKKELYNVNVFQK